MMTSPLELPINLLLSHGDARFALAQYGQQWAPGDGIRNTIVVDGVTFIRIIFAGAYLDNLISSQPLYARAS